MSGRNSASAHLTSSVGALRRAILDFGRHGLRPLPWRATRDPWSVLVSETMLQQTQAARVVEPYRRFLARFPTAAACAGATAGDVLRAWHGLGYNRRALNLHRAATVLLERHGGTVPADLAALQALPGVGPYTARAVLAFAFEVRVGVVDGNVGRVLGRAVAGRRLNAGEAQALADALVPARQAWLWNQSLMEVGATRCHSRVPDCGRCPLAARCAWHRAGHPSPDPGASSARQAPFPGSDRQGRGRLVAALRRGPVEPAELARVAGWPEDPRRAVAVAGALVAEGLACRRPDGTLVLP